MTDWTEVPIFEREELGGAKGGLVETYATPPFSVLDTRQGYWQDRRRRWLALGIRSEIGRGFNDLDPTAAARRAALQLTGLVVPATGATNGAATRKQADQASNVTGAPSLDSLTYETTFGMEHVAPGTSVFDPVLCELMYRWFASPGGVVLDPFAGGSVRGVVAGFLGHPYHGIDLSSAQVEANRMQAELIWDDVPDGAPRPSWYIGDTRRFLAAGHGPEEVDFVFTCPPYYDLEVYSDDPDDLSRAPSWPAFIDAYQDIIGLSLARLKRGSFAAIVVSEIRGPEGVFRGLVPATIHAFQLHGARYYNEAILINAAGTLPLRAARQFEASRKLGRTHQNILVFVKGDVPRTHDWDHQRATAPDPQRSFAL